MAQEYKTLRRRKGSTFFVRNSKGGLLNPSYKRDFEALYKLKETLPSAECLPLNSKTQPHDRCLSQVNLTLHNIF